MVLHRNRVDRADAPVDKPRQRKRWGRAAAAAAAIAAVVASSLAFAVPAQAAASGPGFSGEDGDLRVYITPNGLPAPCWDVSQDWPSGSTGSGVVVGGLGAVSGTRAVSGRDLAVFSGAWNGYYSGVWGSWTDDVNSGAIAAVTYAISSENHPGLSRHYIDLKTPNQAAADAVWDRAQQMWAYGQQQADASGGPTSAQASIVVNADYTGTISWNVSPTSATGTMSIEGAAVAGSGASTAPVANGVAVPIVATPTDDENEKYSVSVPPVTFTAPGGPAQNITVYETAGQQRIVTAGTTNNISFTSSAFVTDPLPTAFGVELVSQVPERIVPWAAPVTDQVTVSLAEGSRAWRKMRDGSPMPLNYRYEVYANESNVRAEPGADPAGYTLVGTYMGVFDQGAGTYELPEEAVELIKSYADRGAEYYSLYSVRIADQPERFQAMLTADAADVFAAENETTIGLNLTTKATPVCVVDGDPCTETAIVKGEIPEGATVRSTKYQAEFDANGAPVCVPENVLHATEEFPIAAQEAGATAEYELYSKPLTQAEYNLSPDGAWWVEEILVDGEVFGTGPCGNPAETHEYKPKPVPAAAGLASTGFDGTPFGWAAGGALAIGLALFTAAAVRRTRKASMTDAE